MGVCLRIMATLSSSTVSDILQLISDLRGESAVNTDALRIRAVSNAERDFARRNFWRVHLIRNATTTGDGTGDYTIGSSTYPMREKGLSEVYIGGQTEDKRVAIVDYMQYQNLINNNAAAKIAYEWYDQATDAWKMHINPVVAVADTIYYSYFFQPPIRTATSDAVICPNIRVIALLAMADIYHGEEELQKEQLAKQEAEQLIEELIGMEQSPAHNQLYAMTAIENSITPRGFGSY